MARVTANLRLMNSILRHAVRAAILAVAIALAGCGEHHDEPAEQAGTLAPTETTATRSAAPRAQGDSAIALEPIDSKGIKALAADGRANATLVSVWATWCEPCRQEFPDLLAAVEAHRAEGLRLVLVSTDFDEQLPEVRRFLAQHGVRETA